MLLKNNIKTIRLIITTASFFVFIIFSFLSLSPLVFAAGSSPTLQYPNNNNSQGFGAGVGFGNTNYSLGSTDVSSGIDTNPLILFGTTAQAPAPEINYCDMSKLSTFRDIVLKFVIGCVAKNVTYFITAIAFVVFLWGIFKLFWPNGENKQPARDMMFWGVIGIFVMVSIWGLVAILQNTFQISGNYSVTPRPVVIPK